MDNDGNFYFVSTRSYNETFSTLYRGEFSDGTLQDVGIVAGISLNKPGIVNFDVDVSPDGKILYFVDAHFGKKGPKTANLVMANLQKGEFIRNKNSTWIFENINTDALEYAAAISQDGLTLLFTRAKKSLLSGEVAMYIAKRKSTKESFEKPVKLDFITGFVEAPTFNQDETGIYYHKKIKGKFMLFFSQLQFSNN